MLKRGSKKNFWPSRAACSSSAYLLEGSAGTGGRLWIERLRMLSSSVPDNELRHPATRRTTARIDPSKKGTPQSRRRFGREDSDMIVSRRLLELEIEGHGVLLSAGTMVKVTFHHPGIWNSRPSTR